MILFFGIRPGKTTTINIRHIKCSHCNQPDTLSGESTPNFFHIFWIPLFRVSTTQVIGCNYCKKGYYKEEFTKEMQAAFEN
ncbi:zinc-ribbon domain-containing protein [uncultured Eudoraea sp.]|uniref:zinc-ribbon domain-containing protein n=1 Tax=uncultured Eudoraea sp. TaxID=1035614 RepID=UPI0026317251|nr:zinc-ribbon domain-containing protein [uncultured Eudoraea sp.]